MTRPNRTDHIRLTSHPAPGAKPRFPIAWGAATARERGPIIGTVSRPADRNVIGTHGGSYAVYRALAVSSGALDPIRRADLTNTQPAVAIGPFAQWVGAPRRSSRSTRGATWSPRPSRAEIAEGIDIRPSIAVTRARLDLPRDAAGGGGGPARQRRRGRAAGRRPVRGQDRHRPGLASAGHRRALRRHAKRACAARCSSRRPACSPSW